MMIDPSFPMEGELAELIAKVGLASDRAIVADPLNHYGTDALKVAVPYYPPHPVTERVAMSIFPEARPIHIGQAPAGVRVNVLAASSADSYVQPVAPSPEEKTHTIRAATNSGVTEHRQETLAVAVEGRWPNAPANQDKAFRLVLVGNSNFAANAYFPYVSNGDLAVGMIRWLAGDEAMPPVKPQTFSLEQIDLTARQMRNIFVLVELALPLAVIVFGGVVWWRRR
jgi:hypothetical protein